jgi:hypothetical protein
VVTLITAVTHLLQIALWGVLLRILCKEVPTFEMAVYVSAENYTALGYEDVIKSEWRLLGPLEAVNGLLQFGLSSAVLFAVMSRLISTRLHHDGERHDAKAAPTASVAEVANEGDTSQEN